MLVACLLLFAAPAPAPAQTFEIRGKGFGHGVGMSQWGAYGQARDGRGHKRILRHYFKKTRVAKGGARQVRVLLSVRPRAVKFKRARRACNRKLKPQRTFQARLSRSGGKVRLERANGKKIKSCGKRLAARSKGKIRIEGDGTYRGDLLAVAASGSLNVVNRVKIDAYLRGVVPGEVPTSWPAAALRAQAVAARSYALATRLNGQGFELYDDTRSQVYGGVAAEEPTTDQAVKRTRRQVVKHNGSVIPTYFFSSSGGRTESSEYGFSGGSPRPYLKSVRDPWDKGSPHHSWRVRLSRAEMESKLGSLVQGRLRRIRVLERGDSPRVVRARVVGSAGKTTVSGDDLRWRLGLRSTWLRFKKL